MPFSHPVDHPRRAAHWGDTAELCPACATVVYTESRNSSLAFPKELEPWEVKKPHNRELLLGLSPWGTPVFKK